MKKIVTIDSITEQISLSEAKEHLRVFDDSEDAYINSLIITARKLAENKTRQHYGDQTVKLTFTKEDELGNMIVLASPFIAITSVKADGVDITNYKIRDNKLYFDEVVKYDELEIIHTVGKVAPYPVRSAMFLIIGHLFENRELSSDVEMFDIPFGIDRLFGLDIEVV